MYILNSEIHIFSLESHFPTQKSISLRNYNLRENLENTEGEIQGAMEGGIESEINEMENSEDNIAGGEPKSGEIREIINKTATPTGGFKYVSLATARNTLKYYLKTASLRKAMDRATKTTYSGKTYKDLMGRAVGELINDEQKWYVKRINVLKQIKEKNPNLEKILEKK